MKFLWKGVLLTIAALLMSGCGSKVAQPNPSALSPDIYFATSSNSYEHTKVIKETDEKRISEVLLQIEKSVLIGFPVGKVNDERSETRDVGTTRVTSVIGNSTMAEANNTFSHPDYKKGYFRIVSSSSWGDETSFVYYGAIRWGDSWAFYVTYPKGRLWVDRSQTAAHRNEGIYFSEYKSLSGNEVVAKSIGQIIASHYHVDCKVDNLTGRDKDIFVKYLSQLGAEENFVVDRR